MLNGVWNPGEFLFAAAVEQNQHKSEVKVLGQGSEEVNWGQGLDTFREKHRNMTALLKITS